MPAEDAQIIVGKASDNMPPLPQIADQGMAIAYWRRRSTNRAYSAAMLSNVFLCFFDWCSRCSAAGLHIPWAAASLSRGMNRPRHFAVR